jgi:hypothetical protein
MDLVGEDTETILSSIIEKIDKSSILNDPEIKNNYIEFVRKWLVDWARLDKLTQEFLPSGELLLDVIQKSHSNDYSPFILQYCRALENEILCKMFSAYNDDLNRCITDKDAFLLADLQNEKLKKFALSLKNKDKRYTLGEMSFILNMANPKSKTFTKSPVLKDFRNFVLQYFKAAVLDEKYLAQIKNITNDFRNRAAHPGLLDLALALDCQKAVRQCINDFLWNYKTPSNHTD